MNKIYLKKTPVNLIQLIAIASLLSATSPCLATPISQISKGEQKIRKDIGQTTGGEGWSKKKYKTTKVNGKKIKNIPPEDILMQKVVETPPAPKNEGRSIRISLSNQRAWLYEDGKPVLVSAITPGKKSSPTPKGKFHIINKHRHWTSTIYNVPMPYFLRLNPGYFGLHQGQMRVTPASHGCIRLPEKDASEFFALARVGDPVWIE
jgi:lipoprotein-anchoring transpeptidase ErfK/SrfK